MLRERVESLQLAVLAFSDELDEINLAAMTTTSSKIFTHPRFLQLSGPGGDWIGPPWSPMR